MIKHHFLLPELHSGAHSALSLRFFFFFTLPSLSHLARLSHKGEGRGTLKVSRRHSERKSMYYVLMACPRGNLSMK